MLGEASPLSEVKSLATFLCFVIFTHFVQSLFAFPRVSFNGPQCTVIIAFLYHKKEEEKIQKFEILYISLGREFDTR